MPDHCVLNMNCRSEYKKCNFYECITIDYKY